MNRREIIIKYMIEKDGLLKDITGISLYDYIDYQEIDSWEKRRISFVYKQLSLFKGGGTSLSMNDRKICPQCIETQYTHLLTESKAINLCRGCAYGERHLYCGDQRESTYKKLIKNLKVESITHMIGSDLALFIRYNFK